MGKCPSLDENFRPIKGKSMCEENGEDCEECWQSMFVKVIVSEHVKANQ